MRMGNFIAVVYSSRYGHTERIADAIADGIASAGSEVEIFTTIEAAHELGHLDNAAGFVFGAPTYMGNMASEMKLFMEKSVNRWYSRAWSGKIAGGFTNSSNFSGEKVNTMMGMMVYAMQMGMIWVGLDEATDQNCNIEGPNSFALNRIGSSIGPMACSFSAKVPDAPSIGDIQTAENYGRRIASIVQRFSPLKAS